MKTLFIFVFSIVVVQAQAVETAPYAGQQTRMIKSSSSLEIEGLKQGKGMGLAKAAELNHYPGPKHVLDEASKLSLSKIQLAQTKKLFNAMEKEAVVVGKKIISAEQSLDKMFSDGKISAIELKIKLNEIGKYRAQLRFVHLKTHLEQKEILSSQQIKHYDKLRGYSGNMANHQHHNMHH